jgi:hypothetical protein
VIGQPGSSIILKIESNAIDPDKIEMAYQGEKSKSIYIKAWIRLCIAGEYQSSDNKCLLCPGGFFTLKEDQKECEECPDNAICANGN